MEANVRLLPTKLWKPIGDILPHIVSRKIQNPDFLPPEDTMKVIAYLRVSRDTQDTNHQKLAILQFAQQKGISIDQFIELTISSQKSQKQRRVDTLLQQLDAGDSLIVSELSRLGRSVGEIVTLVDNLAKNKIGVLAVKEGIHLQGNQDLATKVMITMFSLFAEIERELISKRTQEALAAVKAAGKRLGRPKGALGRSKLDGRKEEIEHLLGLGVSKSAIAKITAVDRSTLYHFIKTRALNSNQQCGQGVIPKSVQDLI